MLTSYVLRCPWSSFVDIVTAYVLRVVVLLVSTTLGYCHAGEQQGAPELDHEFVHKSVESVAAAVDREYFDAAIAAQVASSLRTRLADGGYGEVKTLKSLA